jgi:hypothetical protein
MLNEVVYERSQENLEDSHNLNPKQRAEVIIGGSVTRRIAFLLLRATAVLGFYRRRHVPSQRNSLVLATDPVPEVLQPQEGAKSQTASGTPCTPSSWTVERYREAAACSTVDVPTRRYEKVLYRLVEGS